MTRDRENPHHDDIAWFGIIDLEPVRPLTIEYLFNRLMIGRVLIVVVVSRQLDLEALPKHDADESPAIQTKTVSTPIFEWNSDIGI